ncbi:hypothetical protein ABXT66_10895 [Candidatus Levibacter sp. Uisw_134_01]|uniref:hypothetical protein n=1 Tax=Candidatus Levibacter sp. Uisw_134_01 TaxID=3230999 RepID=UPI003D53C8F5
MPNAISRIYLVTFFKPFYTEATCITATQSELVGQKLAHKSSLKSGLNIRGFSLGSGKNERGFCIYIVIPILYKKSSLSAAFQ